MKKILSYFFLVSCLFAQNNYLSLNNENNFSRNLAIKYLISKQNKNGSWGNYGGNPAYTALVIRSLCQEKDGKKKYKKILEKAINYLKINITPDFAVINPGPRPYKTYTSAIAVIAFYLYDKEKYKNLIIKIRNFLKNAQFNDSHGIEAGGIGYGSNKYKSDLSNTQYALEALHITENISPENKQKEDLIWKRAIDFISRCQISPDNELPWIKTDDKKDIGGFIYSPDRSMVKGKILKSYGSMTYAAIKSMIFARLSPEDKRIKLALKWIRSHYTTEENPNLGQMGYYYYINTFSKALKILNIEKLIDDKKQVHYWKKDLITSLISKQKADGYWVNTIGRWQENNPILATCYSLMALQYASNDIKSFYELTR